MFDSVRFLLFSTLIASIAIAAPADVQQSADPGKEKPVALEEKGEKGGYEPPPPVVTEHTVTLAEWQNAQLQGDHGLPPDSRHQAGDPAGEGLRQGTRQREWARPA